MAPRRNNDERNDDNDGNDNGNNDRNKNKEHKSLATRALIDLQVRVGSAASPAWLTRVAARRWAQARNPARVESFIRDFGVDYASAERCSTANTPRSCATKYGSLNEFFTRKLRGGVVADRGAAVVSPASCMCVLYRDVAHSTVWVKGRRWGLDELVRAKLPAGRQMGVGIFRLRPVDYHRFHSPVDGTVRSVTFVRGSYLSVDPAVVRSTRDPLTENARRVYVIDTAYGPVYFVAVGAAGVGAVRSSVRAGDAVSRGDELGYFEFGGSTVVVLLPPRAGLEWDRDISRASLRGKETYVTVGQAVGQATRR